MNYLLISGAPNVGKTGTIYRLTEFLITHKSFKVICGQVPSSQKDFIALIEGYNQQNQKIIIAVNSASDNTETISKFKEFLSANNNFNVSIIISSIRDHNFFPRKIFFEIMDINDSNIDIEIPLAKITRRKQHKNTAMQWYKNKIDNLVQFILNRQPFNI